jgi:hypothetical protein
MATQQLSHRSIPRQLRLIGEALFDAPPLAPADAETPHERFLQMACCWRLL